MPTPALSPSTASTTPSTIPLTRRNAPAGKTRNRWRGKSIRRSTKTKPSRICSRPPSAAPVKRLLKICAASRKCGTRKKACRASIWYKALPLGRFPRNWPIKSGWNLRIGCSAGTFRRWSAPISIPNASTTTLYGIPCP